MKSYQAGSLMEMVHLEFPGLLPRTEQRKNYILIMEDSSTKGLSMYHHLQRLLRLTQGQLSIFCFLKVWVFFQDLLG